MAWNVILLGEVEDWYLDLGEADSPAADAVTGAIDLLEQVGPTLGRPIVDKVTGSSFHTMKVLRPAGTSIRVLFDPQRRAVLPVAGDKAGQWAGWYDESMPIADERYRVWLESDT